VGLVLYRVGVRDCKKVGAKRFALLSNGRFSICITRRIKASHESGLVVVHVGQDESKQPMGCFDPFGASPLRGSLQNALRFVEPAGSHPASHTK
jgi:hypothetical protein